MTDRTDAVARMLETVDLLGKVTASISERLDRQDQQLRGLTALVDDCRHSIGKLEANSEISAKAQHTETTLLHSALADLKQKITDLKALYAEADRYFERVKHQHLASNQGVLQRPWRIVLLAALCFSTGLLAGVYMQAA